MRSSNSQSDNVRICYRSSVANDVRKEITGSYIPVLKDEKLSVRILVDHSIVESFAQGGRTTITNRIYPTKAIYGAARLFVFNNATETSVTASIKVWQLNSAFIRPYYQDETSLASFNHVTFIKLIAPFFIFFTLFFVR